MLTSITATLGLITGLTGLLLSLRNYWLDRERVIVKLEWDIPERNSWKHSGYITVTNVGRRPIFITSIGLEIGCEHSLLPFKSDLYDGTSVNYRLNESDQPLIVRVPQDSEFLLGHAEFWPDIRAFAIDAKEKVHLAQKVDYCPSWGKGKGRSTEQYCKQGRVLWLSLPLGKDAITISNK